MDIAIRFHYLNTLEIESGLEENMSDMGRQAFIETINNLKESINNANLMINSMQVMIKFLQSQFDVANRNAKKSHRLIE